MVSERIRARAPRFVPNIWLTVSGFVSDENARSISHSLASSLAGTIDMEKFADGVN